MFERFAQIRFAQPQWLLLLLVLPLVFYWGRKSIAGLGTFRSVSSLVVRCLVAAALAAALARVQLVLVRDDMAVAFVVDMSLSIPADNQVTSLDQVASWQQQTTRGPGDQVALVTFGTNAAIDQPFTTEAVDTTALRAVVRPDHTDLAAAIRTAIAAMPQTGRKRLVLLTDGNENNGAAVAEAATAKSSGVRIDCLPVRYGYDHEVMIEKIIAPQETAAGKTASVSVLVRAFNPADGTLRLFANGVPIAEQEVHLKPGINVYVIERPLESSGVYDFKASIDSADDNLHQNNTATAYTIVRGEKKVLIVEGGDDDAATLAQALRGDKVAVDVIKPANFPNALSLMTGYDTVILANVAAYDLPAEQIQTLAAAVKDYGVGLVMVGGPDSFGAGGWKGTPVEEALPVEMDVKDRQVVPTGALVIIMHTCEFADGNRWGINIAKAALDTLGQYDEFGVLHYSYQIGGERWLVPLAPVTDRGKIKAVINRMQAGDMPTFVTTMQMAEAALVKSQAAVKHIVIISDGDPSAPAPSYMQQLAAKNITVSTVAVFPHGGQSTGNMKAIAQLCNGRFYQPASASQLPQIFIKEARTVRRGLIFETPFIPTMVMNTVPLTGFAPGAFPELLGYVITTPKPLAEVPLLTNNDDPLLAHWQCGLGRAVAFTSDAKAKWASKWVAWGEYRRFWGQVVEWVERKVETGEFTTNCAIRGDTATISIDAIDRSGEYVNFLQFSGTVLSPDAQAAPLKLEQTAPGHYEGTFQTDEIGTYLPIVSYTDSKGAARTYSTAVTIPFSPEYRALSTNDVLLKQLSDLTGGKVIAPEVDVFRRDFPAQASYSDIWQWVLAAACALFLLDVFLRRVIIDYAAVWEAFRDAVYWLPYVGRRQLAGERIAYTSTLLSVKKVTREQRQESARKFVGDAETPLVPIEEIERDQALTRSRARAEKIDQASAPSSEVTKAGEDTFTGRLLEAKRKARKDRNIPEG